MREPSNYGLTPYLFPLPEHTNAMLIPTGVLPLLPTLRRGGNTYLAVGLLWLLAVAEL